MSDEPWAGRMTEYTWIFVVAIIFSFIGAFGIGANDVANAFATSVGAKSVTVKQAVVIATIFEFAGAFFMGSHVSKTIRKGICDIDLFTDSQEDAELLMFGMMCVTFSVAFWLLLATYFSLPVSTTHTCVGSVMGIAIAAKGWDAVDWNKVSLIIVSWFVSPILSGVFAVCLYLFIRNVIMMSEDPQGRTIMLYPVLTAFCVIIVIFYTIYKGTPQLGLKSTGLGVASAVAFGGGIFMAALTYGLFVPWLRQKLADFEPEKAEEQEDGGTKRDGGAAYSGDDGDGVEMTENGKVAATVQVNGEFSDTDKEETDKSAEEATAFSRMKTIGDSVVVDVEKRFQDQATDQVLEMLANAETHDAHAEHAFSYLQVFSACFAAFAHGANDVANSVGPMAAVYAIWDTGVVEKKVDMPLWILGMGGVGIVAGLVLYGYNIMQVIGFELTKLSPSRGFSIELGAALVVLTGSRLEIPLSTTHCQVGATVGVGLTEGIGNVNWMLFARVAAGWIVTLLVASLMSAAVFSYAVYSPQA